MQQESSTRSSCTIHCQPNICSKPIRGAFLSVLANGKVVRGRGGAHCTVGRVASWKYAQTQQVYSKPICFLNTCSVL